jgi:2',3'-cyclic-nucleotide 2'-phosphodiesterase (5'-nucleotidase family)
MLSDHHPERSASVLAIALAVIVVAGSIPGAAGLTAQSTETTQVSTEVSIQDIQEPTGDNSSSPYQGENVTTDGVVTAVNADGFFLQNETGAWSGVFVYTNGSASVSVGDTADVTGVVEEQYGFTQINAAGEMGTTTVTGSATVPDPTSVTTAEADSEAYEGVVVAVENVTVTSAPGQYGEWDVSDGSGGVAVDDVNLGNVTVPEESGGTIERLTGPVNYDFEEFKIQPQTLTNYTAPDGNTGTPVNGTQLTVLMYNDVQTAASNAEQMGRLVGAINDRKSSIENPTVVVGGGDQISPSSLSPVSNWTVPVETLNVLNPAAEVVGNHDLDFGFDGVTNFSAASEFPWLVANIEQTETGDNIPGTKDHTIVERGDMRIGIVGLVDDAVKGKTAVDFSAQGYEVRDHVTVGSQVATDLKENHDVDVVIAAAHVGIPESKELARNTDNIDVIVAGDDEVAFGPKTVSGTAIVEAEARAAYVGEVNLTVGDSEVAMSGGDLLPVGENDGFPTNETANQTVADARGKFLSKVAGETTVSLDSRFSSNYAEDTTWGNIITDAFIAETGGDVALTNAGGIRGNFVIEPGNMTYDDIYTSLPFGNYLVTKEMTGEQLRELLASQVTSLDANYGAQAQLQVSGVTYEFIDAPDSSQTVTDVYVEGEPLDPDATYNVTLNSYMSGWTFGERYGWNMSDLTTVDTDRTLYGTAAVNYVEANTPISGPGIDRIRRITRTVDSTTVSTGDETTTIELAVPDAVQSVNAPTIHVHNATSGSVSATTATLANGTLTATFDQAALSDLAAGSQTLALYTEYTDSAYTDNRGGFSTSVLNADVSVLAVQPGTSLSPIVGEQPPRDPDGDGVYEDINGDGTVGVIDVQALFANLDSQTVSNNQDAFDFNNDGEVDVIDVQRFFTTAAS